jgi:hypothetical protein
MGKKKRGKSGKKIARRVGPGDEPKQREAAPEPEEAKPRIPERIREQDSGFGVIKVVVGVIVVLILGAGVLSRLVGNEESSRGDKIAGELCGSTQECQSGSICFSYGDDKKRCLVTCPKGKTCEPGYSCVSSAERAGRKSTRVRAVCVEDAKVEPEDK